MNLTYKIAIGIIFVLGVGHAGFTFKKYNTFQPDALWFFATALVLIFNGLLNYINLAVKDNQLIERLTIGANILQLFFYVVLAVGVPVLTVFAAIIVAVVLLISSVYFYVT